MNKIPCYLIGFLAVVAWIQPAHAQIARRVEKDSSAYEGLVRTNLELRKELQELEKKYADLENERKVLILHVRDLQTTRDTANAEMQGLKSKIAALRIEMLKDPKMVKTLDELNQRIQETAREKVELQKRTDILTSEKTKLLNEMKVVRDLYDKQKETAVKECDRTAETDGKEKEQNEQLAKEMERMRAKLQKAEDELTGMKAELQKKIDTAVKEKMAEVSMGDDERIRKMESEFREAEAKLKDEVWNEQSKYTILEREKQDLQREFAEARIKLESADAALEKEKVQIGNVDIKEIKRPHLEKRNQDLEREISAARELLAQARAETQEQIKKANEEKARLQKALRDGDQGLTDRTREMNREIARLEVDLKRAENDRERISKKMTEAEKEKERAEEENLLLAKENKDMAALIKERAKESEAAVRESKYSKEYLTQKAKDASADKLMLEAKVHDLQERTAAAEAKLTGLDEELRTKTAKTSLQESEIMVLREEKSKLEQKLIRYIEKILEEEKSGPKSVKLDKRSGAEYQDLPEGKNIQSKREADQQKLDMHYNLAIAYDRRGMYKEERQEYLKCLKINPRDSNVHYNLAILYDDKLNMNEKAIEHYRKFMELRPVGEDIEKVKSWMLRAEQEIRLGPEMR